MSAFLIEGLLTVSFSYDHFVTQEVNTKMLIDKGERFDALYVLDINKLSTSFLAHHVYVNNVSVRIWHNRLGHPLFKRLAWLKYQLNYDVTMLNKNDPCYVYPLAK